MVACKQDNPAVVTSGADGGMMDFDREGPCDPGAQAAYRGRRIPRWKAQLPGWTTWARCAISPGPGCLGSSKVDENQRETSVRAATARPNHVDAVATRRAPPGAAPSSSSF
jgi:hypothetical protein